MNEHERPLMDRVWEFTKDISVKVSRKAEKHWKINTLRVEIASVRHRINVKYKELGRYVYESVKSQTLEEDSYKASLREFFDELKRLEGEILQRENRIEILEQEMREFEKQRKSTPPPIPETLLAEDERGDSEPEQDPPPATAEKEQAEAQSPTESNQEGHASNQATDAIQPEKSETRSKPKSTAKSTPRKKTTRIKKTE